LFCKVLGDIFGSPGIGIHADFAAINVNFWITPDDANLDPKSGGIQLRRGNSLRTSERDP
jgi:hypothetical protein